jgi:SAM-dependent methyltransferase
VVNYLWCGTRTLIDSSQSCIGHGHTVRYLNRQRVSRYIALEPNPLMHPHIRALASAAGFHEADGTLVLLSCGAEDTSAILSALAPASSAGGAAQPPRPPVDTIVSVLTLCTVPRPARCVAGLVRDVLAPGGQFLMYEHVLSRRADVAWWQRLWAPVWALGFDGCRMDRASDVLLRDLTLTGEDGEEATAWREFTLENQESDEEALLVHIVGRFVKA